MEIRPDHYKSDESGKGHWDRMWELYREAWFVMNVSKYCERYRGKDGLKDLYKARTYLEKLIELEEAEVGGKPVVSDPDTPDVYGIPKPQYAESTPKVDGYINWPDRKTDESVMAYPRKCLECHGTGVWKPTPKTVGVCVYCNGHGQVYLEPRKGETPKVVCSSPNLPKFEEAGLCTHCNGKGSVSILQGFEDDDTEAACPHCNGRGFNDQPNKPSDISPPENAT
jgi:hypothetical protein